MDSVTLTASKLRVGVLLDSGRVPAWIAQILNLIQASEHSELVLFVIGTSPDNPAESIASTPSGTPVQTLRKVVRSLLLSFNRRWVEMPSSLPSALTCDGIEPAFSGVPQINVLPSLTAQSDCFNNDTIAAIRSHDLDVLLYFGGPDLRGAVLTVARYGVWSYQHGDNRINRGGPPGFWEVMQLWPEIGCTLQVLGEDVDNRLVLARSSTAMVPESLAETNDNAYWKAVFLVPRQLRLLHGKGAERFFAEARNAEPDPQFYSRRLYASPSNREIAALVASKFWRKLRLRLGHEFGFDQWILMWHVADDFSSALWRYQRVLPPKDRFWADPFVMQRGARYYVFFEEFPFARQKGHISVIEVDAHGKPGSAQTALVADHHLSYPFVFEHDGQTYMIPESRAANCIALYRCIEFPLRWEKLMNLMDGVAALDTTLYFRDGRWWMFTNLVQSRAGSNSDELHVFFAPKFATNQWTPHPMNPVVCDVRRARSAGRLFERNGRLYRPSQDCGQRYGWGLNLNVIERLNEIEYAERLVTKAEPAWANDVLAIHTYNSAGRLHVVDAQIRRQRHRD